MEIETVIVSVNVIAPFSKFKQHGNLIVSLPHIPAVSNNRNYFKCLSRNQSVLKGLLESILLSQLKDTGNKLADNLMMLGQAEP